MSMRRIILAGGDDDAGAGAGTDTVAVSRIKCRAFVSSKKLSPRTVIRR